MSRRRLLLLALLAMVAALPLLRRDSALAHPLGNFTVNRYARIEVYRDAIRVHYALDIAEIPTFQLQQDIGDSQQALDRWAGDERAAISRSLALQVGDQRLPLNPLDAAAHFAPGQGGLAVTRFDAVYQAALPANTSGQLTLAFRDDNDPGRPGWREIVVRPSAGAMVDVDPSLTVDRSDALRSYPAETLQSAPNVRHASFSFVPGTGQPARQAVKLTSAAAAARSVGGFAGLLDHDQSLAFILLALLAAFGFGALHALGPGHGKTVVAAYLVGSKGTARHALALGFTVTATHTSTVYLLGFVTLVASQYIVPETLYLWLGVASGAMVVVMGLSLFAGRLLQLRRATPGEHRHGAFGRSHSHGPQQHDHEHEDSHSLDHAETRVSWRSLLTLGVAGGLLPCPSAIVVMLAAISLGQVVFGMLLIVAFSLGLAGVLTTIGIALVLGKRLSARSARLRSLQRPGLARAMALLPVVSALGIAVAGVAITYQAWSV